MCWPVHPVSVLCPLRYRWEPPSSGPCWRRNRPRVSRATRYSCWPGCPWSRRTPSYRSDRTFLFHSAKMGKNFINTLEIYNFALKFVVKNFSRNLHKICCNTLTLRTVILTFDKESGAYHQDQHIMISWHIYWTKSLLEKIWKPVN